MNHIRQVTLAAPPTRRCSTISSACSARRARNASTSPSTFTTPTRIACIFGVVLAGNQVWIAEVDETLAGFVAFADGWVNHLYVAPAFQGRWLGTRLLDLAKQANPAVQLWVFQVNTPAIHFYERRGFRVAERTDGSANAEKQPDARMTWTRGDGR